MSVGLRERKGAIESYSYSYLGSDSTGFHKLTRHVERARERMKTQLKQNPLAVATVPTLHVPCFLLTATHWHKHHWTPSSLCNDVM